jgi:hypothetical protein
MSTTKARLEGAEISLIQPRELQRDRPKRPHGGKGARGNSRIALIENLESNPPNDLYFTLSESEVGMLDRQECQVYSAAESKFDVKRRGVPDTNYFLGLRPNVLSSLRTYHRWIDDGLESLRVSVRPLGVELDMDEKHPESVIQYCIRDGKRKIATFGFYSKVVGGTTELHICNIQGSDRGDEEDSPLKTLTERLGESWRVHIARSLKDFGERHGMRVVGDLIVRDVIRCTPSKYRRQLRQYLQTYRKAGISDVDSSMVTLNDTDGSDERSWRQIVTLLRKVEGTNPSDN